MSEYQVMLMDEAETWNGVRVRAVVLRYPSNHRKKISKILKDTSKEKFLQNPSEP